MGVWLIVPYNSSQDIMGTFIEITRLTSILAAQTKDMEEALASLQLKLEE